MTALIKSLPKELRRNFVPAPDTARAILDDLNPGTGSLLTEMQRELRRRSGVVVPIEAFDLSKIPDHLRVTFAVETADGTEVARGKDLAGLQDRLAAPVQRGGGPGASPGAVAAHRPDVMAGRSGRVAAHRRTTQWRAHRPWLPGLRRHRYRGGCAGVRRPRPNRPRG